MIIDPHAHYNNNAYKKPFRHLAYLLLHNNVKAY